MRTGTAPLDLITLEVVYNGLLSIVDESFYALMKSAYSTNIKERHDHSCCIIDRQCRLIVQASRTQVIHLSSMMGHVRAVLEKLPQEDIRPGDVFISNDPYAAGGTHLPDINFAAPLFVDHELIGFSCNIAHHADVGGMTAGSMSSNVSEIYQEGLRIPVVRLLHAGEFVTDVMDLILLNVRNPNERRGDYFAQIAACRVGVERFASLAAAHGANRIKSVFDEIVQLTEGRMRRMIEVIPDGEYAFKDVIDDDGMGNTNIPICLNVSVHGSDIRFDFAGTASQVRGNVNSPLSAVIASVGYAVIAMLDPEIPCNQGVLNALNIVAEPGTILNSTFPAPVAARTHTCQRVVDVVIGALARALPRSAIAASNGSNTMAIISGIDPRNGRQYLYFETYGGGCGARADKDGKDGVQVHIPNTANTPIEVMETEFPLLVEEYCLVPDTGGAGAQRGGLALRRVIRPLGHTCSFTGAGERFVTPPWGLFGGKPGATGKFMLLDDDGSSRVLEPKPSSQICGPNQCVVVQSPGAGGYGDPRERDAARMRQDWRGGKFSTAYFALHYGMQPEQLQQLPGDGAWLDYAEDG